MNHGKRNGGYRDKRKVHLEGTIRFVTAVTYSSEERKFEPWIQGDKTCIANVVNAIDKFFETMGRNVLEITPKGMLKLVNNRESISDFISIAKITSFPFDIFLIADSLILLGFNSLDISMALSYLFNTPSIIFNYEPTDIATNIASQSYNMFRCYTNYAIECAISFILNSSVSVCGDVKSNNLMFSFECNNIPQVFGGESCEYKIASRRSGDSTVEPTSGGNNTGRSQNNSGMKLKEFMGPEIPKDLYESEQVQKIVKTGLVSEQHLRYLLPATNNNLDLAYISAIASVYPYKRGVIKEQTDCVEARNNEVAILVSCFPKLRRITPANSYKFKESNPTFFINDVELWDVEIESFELPGQPKFLARFHIQRRLTFEEINNRTTPHLPLVRDHAGEKVVMWKPHRGLAGAYPDSPPLFEVTTVPDNYLSSYGLQAVYYFVAKGIYSTNPSEQPILQACLMMQGELTTILRSTQNSIGKTGKSIFGTGAPDEVKAKMAEMFRKIRGVGPQQGQKQELGKLSETIKIPTRCSSFTTEYPPSTSIHPEEIGDVVSECSIAENKGGNRLLIPEITKTKFEKSMTTGVSKETLMKNEKAAIMKQMKPRLMFLKKYDDTLAAKAGNNKLSVGEGVSTTSPKSSNSRSNRRNEELTLNARKVTVSEFLSPYNKMLKHPQYEHSQECRKKLPIGPFEDKISSVIRENRVVIISGSTGCGKSTQVPQFILDNIYRSQKAALEEGGEEGGGGKFVQLPQIVVTQPRRIPAISLADRISDERCNVVGEETGYQIRLENRVSRNTIIRFCTVGVLLRQLLTNKTLRGITHLIIDEVHERDIDCDFLLVFLKELVLGGSRPDLHLILMSATLDAGLFAEYFGGAPVLEVPGFTYPVEVNHLESFILDTDFVPESGDTNWEKLDDASRSVFLKKAAKLRMRLKNFGVVSDDEAEGDVKGLERRLLRALLPPETDEEAIELISSLEDKAIVPRLIVSVLGALCGSQGKTKLYLPSDDGAILVFLPGLRDITDVRSAMLDSGLFSERDGFTILCCHSSLPEQEQRRIFQQHRKGERKIILSTNITESSVTIDDVTMVIDTGLCRRTEYKARKGVASLRTGWVSKASSQQRKGRAGRTRPGRCFRLYTSARFNSMPESEIPEMRRAPLHSLVLQILAMGIRDPFNFLGRALEPPSPVAIAKVLRELTTINIVSDCGSLTEKNFKDFQLEQKDILTPLGVNASALPVHPRVARIILIGAVMGCLEPILVIAACLSVSDIFSSPIGGTETLIRIKRELSDGIPSDFLCMLNAFRGWEKARRSGRREEQQYIRSHFLSRSALDEVSKLKGKLYDNLAGNIDYDLRSDSGLNKYSDNTDVILSCISGGLYPQFVMGSEKENRYGLYVVKSGDKRLIVHPTSVAFKTKRQSSFFCYERIFKTTQMFCVNVSIVPPLASLLFGFSIDVDVVKRHIIIDKHGRYSFPNCAALIPRLRLVRRIYREAFTSATSNISDGLFGHVEVFRGLVAPFVGSSD